MFKLKKKEERNQIIEKAEEIILKCGFTGRLEDDLQLTDSPVEKKAYMIETLLYKYEHSDNKFSILKKLNEEIGEFNKLSYETGNGETLQETYENIVKEAENKFAEKKCMYNGNEITFKAFPCGEYFDGEDFAPVIAKAIFMNEESLYEIIPTEGLWSVATRFQDLNLVSLGMFDDPRDAFGYIEYCCS